MEVMQAFDSYVARYKERFLAELRDFCRIPSIAATGQGIEEGASWVAERLQKLGAEVRVLRVEGVAPVVMGTIGSGPKRLMIYDHYDVQPPEPLDLWVSGPFEAAVRDGRIYARGAADNKSELLGRIQAVEAYLNSLGELPVQIAFFFEGEEEIGSPGLPRIVEGHRDLIYADGCLWEGGWKDERGRPTYFLGLKGMAYFELICRTASTDLHSMYAAIVPNAAWRLVWALSTLKDPDDRILVEGLSDHVLSPSEEDEAMLDTIHLDEEAMRRNFGLRGFAGDLTGKDLVRRYIFGPTCNIAGLQAGYTGTGVKTVLPKEARAKVDFRLVPNLTPELVHELLASHLAQAGFSDVEVRLIASLHPARSSASTGVARAALSAALEFFGTQPQIYPMLPGSGPMYTLCQGLGIPAISAGTATRADANIHAPNENVLLEDYIENIQYMGRFISWCGRTL
jgi:acetylornithine deacetylase/succinyl-diaminopimelate desuccinylase-like protein